LIANKGITATRRIKRMTLKDLSLKSIANSATSTLFTGKPNNRPCKRLWKDGVVNYG
jgi:hypothetical protein